MSAYRNFDRALEESRGEPVRFTLAGEEFEVHELSAAALFRVIRAPTNVDGYYLSLQDMLGDQFLRFEAALGRSRMELEGELGLEGLVRWISQQLAARPTRPPSDSAPSPSPNGTPVSNQPSSNGSGSTVAVS